MKRSNGRSDEMRKFSCKLLKPFMGYMVAVSLCLTLFTGLAQAETLLETIEAPKMSPFERVTEIKTEVVSEAQQNVENSEDADHFQPTVTEYKIGERVIREYRIAGKLHYVEIVNDGAPSYMIDYASGVNENGLLQNSGIRVTTW